MTGDRMKFFRLPAVLVALVLAFAATLASAADLDSLRQSGAIVERSDGYVEVRGNSPDAQGVASAVNAERRALYEQRAAQQKVPSAEVGRIYASQIIAKLPPGAWYRKADGSLAQK
jgi:uncharacterized protein